MRCKLLLLALKRHTHHNGNGKAATSYGCSRQAVAIPLKTLQTIEHMCLFGSFTNGCAANRITLSLVPNESIRRP